MTRQVILSPPSFLLQSQVLPSILRYDSAVRRVETYIRHLASADASGGTNLALVPGKGTALYSSWLRQVAVVSTSTLADWLAGIDRLHAELGPCMRRIRTLAGHLSASPYYLDLT